MIKYFKEDIFKDMVQMRTLYSDLFALCCVAGYERGAIEECLPEASVFSSCKDLLPNNWIRGVAWIMGIGSIFLNIYVVAWRIQSVIGQAAHADIIFIIVVAFANMALGVYMIIILIVDLYYRDVYVVNDIVWRGRNLCTGLGIVVTISSELSHLILTVMAVIRCIVITNTWKQIRLSQGKTALIIFFVCTFIISLSVVPISGVAYFADMFYNQNRVCSPLNLRHDRPPGWEYSVVLFLVLNMILTVTMVVCYLVILNQAHSRKVGDGKRKSRGAQKTFIRITSIVTCHLISQLPIFAVSLVGLAGIRMSYEVYPWITVIVLPLPAVTNPILYTFSAREFHSISASKLVMQLIWGVKSRRGREISKLFANVQLEMMTTNRLCWAPIFESTDNLAIVKMADFADWKKLDGKHGNAMVADLRTAVEALHGNLFYHGQIDRSAILIDKSDDLHLGTLLIVGDVGKLNTIDSGEPEMGGSGRLFLHDTQESKLEMIEGTRPKNVADNQHPVPRDLEMLKHVCEEIAHNVEKTDKYSDE
ncbi:G-protein coupled receptor GRL101-like [Ptychodera flava]|uniref:G-protein coupled receptor GRL101-like n=1 Tax=Ptychodera flava TaxID=63121 RepID=UPI003969EAB4